MMTLRPWVGVLLACHSPFAQSQDCPDGSLCHLRKQADAEEPSVEAQLTLGMEYMRGSARTQPKPREGVHWLTKALEAGNVEAMVHMAKLFREGNAGAGVDKDLKRSFELAERAANKGHVEGMDLTAQALWNSWGTGNMPQKKRKKLTKQWLKKAASGGAFTAQIQLADAHREGKFVERDGEEAVKWYKRALATADLLNQTGSGRPLTSDALRLIQKVCITLGTMHYKGHGTEKNNEAALEYMSRAAGLGSDAAQKAIDLWKKEMAVEKQQEELMKDPEVQALLNDPMKNEHSVPLDKLKKGSMDFIEKLTKTEL